MKTTAADSAAENRAWKNRENSPDDTQLLSSRLFLEIKKNHVA
jgi:hypothetical protein